MAVSLFSGVFALSNKSSSNTDAATDYSSAEHIASYYSNVNGSNTALLESIYNTIHSPYTTTAYGSLGSKYPITDPKGNYLYDIYSDNTNYTSGDAGSSASSVGGGWNKEHTIPKSWWGGTTSNQGCDIIIVRLSDIHCNSVRSSYLYGEVGTSQLGKQNPIDDNKYGYCSNYNEIGVTSTTIVFEPRDEIKGDMARTYFYAVARYWENSTGSQNLGSAKNWTSGNGSYVFSSSGTNGFVSKYLSMLLRWHREDPVDAREISRNALVESVQSNRNPFVDHPSWVDLIWGGTYSGTNAENTSAGTVTNGVLDPSAGSLTISASSLTIAPGETAQIKAVSSDGSQISWSTSNSSVVAISSATSASNVNITLTAGNTETTATVTASATINGVTIPRTCNVTVSSSGGGGGGSAEETITLTNTNFGTYTEGVTDSTTYSSTQVGNYNSSIQFKSGEGILYNKVGFENITSIVMTKTNSGSNNTTVYGAATSNTQTTSFASTTSGNVYTYDFSGYSYPYFKIVNGSGASNFTSIVINYSSGGGSSDPTLVSIAVSGMTTQYTVGDDFEFDGTCTATYSDASTFPVEPDSVTSPDMSSAGQKTITVTYEEDGNSASTSYTITVSAPATLSSISVSGQKTQFYVGDTFNFGGTVTAHYSDSTTSDVTGSASFSGYNLSTSGNQTVTVSYSGKSTSYSITVTAITPVSIAVIGQKTNFAVDDSFTFGGTVTATNNNGSTTDVTASTTFSGYNMAVAGQYTVTATYLSLTTTYTINVSEGGHIYPVPTGGTNTYTITFATAESDSSSDIASTITLDNDVVSSNTLVSAFNTSSCSKLYQGISGIKLGSSGGTGTLAFTTNTNVRQNVTSITVTCARYGSDTGTLSFTYGSTSSASFNPSSGSYTLNLQNTPASGSTFSISTSAKRAYISSISFVVTTGGGTTDKEITSIDVSASKTTYHPGETIDLSTVTVTAHYDTSSTFNPTQDITYSLASNYMFTYGDTGTGSSTKVLSVTFAGWTRDINLTVSRVAYGHTGTEDLELTGAEFATGGITTDNSKRSTGTFTVDGLELYVYKSYVYNSKLSFSDTSSAASGYFKNTEAGKAISDISVSVSSVPVKVSVDGNTWYTKSSVDLSTTDYYYFLIGYDTTTSTSGWINISTITITYKVDVATSLANYVMYRDTENQCSGPSGKFATALEIFESLSLSERNTFMTATLNTNYVIATARERFLAWAKHEGKTITYVNNDYIVETGKTPFIVLSSDNNALILILTISSLLAVSFIGFAYYRKKAKKS